MRTSECTTDLNKALAAFHAKVSNPFASEKVNVRSDKGNYSYNYTPLSEILAQVRPLLAEQGLTVTQIVGSEPITSDGKNFNIIAVTTRIQHTTGQWMETDALKILSATNPQAVGTIISYARRYQLSAALNIASDDDDDANGAEGKNAERSSRRATAANKPTSTKASEESDEALASEPTEPAGTSQSEASSAVSSASNKYGDPDPATLTLEQARAYIMPFGSSKGIALEEMNDKALEWVLNRSDSASKTLKRAAYLVLEARNNK